MKTAITDMFGIDVPILAFSHCRDVVAAVTKAGGMGVLGAVAHSDRQLEIDLDWIEDEVGDRPYGVDLIVPAKYAGSDEGGMKMSDLRAMIPPEHQAFVDEILDRYDVPELPEDERGGAMYGSADDAPFSADRADVPQLEIALAHRPGVRGERTRPAAAAHDRPGRRGGPQGRARSPARPSTPNDTSTPAST